MKTAISVVLVGALAVGAVSAVPIDADASDKRHGHHHYYYRPAPYDPAAGIVAGAIVGLAVGALAAPVFYPPYDPYPPPPYWVTGNPNMDWCQANYGTYDPETNLWFDYRGVPHQCVGPY